MATHALPSTKKWTPHPWLWLPLVLMAVAAGLLMIVTMHSFLRHGAEGEQAYNCFQHHGPSAVWRAPNEKKEMAYHFLCMDQMGEFFDVIMREDGKPLSAYRLDARSLQEAINYIRNKPGGTHVPWDRIPQALMDAIKPYLPSGFAGH